MNRGTRNITWRQGNGAGGDIEVRRWDHIRTEHQLAPHEGFEPGAVTRRSAEAFVSEDAAPTMLLARSPVWQQRDDLPCVGMWHIFDEPKLGSPAMNQAKALCADCPVRQECLDDAMAREGSLSPGSRFTVRGGLTPAERSRIRRRGDRAA